MKSYSGSANFKFEIERYAGIDGKFYSGEELTKLGGELNIEGEWITIPLDVSGSASFSPGRYNALPEDCYPDEYDLDIEYVMDSSGKDWQDKLTVSEEKNIEEIIADKSQESYEDDCCDDYEDYDYE